MKIKNVLELIIVSMTITFAPLASALPLFSRQTNLSCVSCHFQHFPLLNSYGRSFKASAFTIKGKQEMVEGNRLSLPVTLNMSALTSAGFEKNNSSPSDTPVKNTGNGTWFVPGSNGEASLFFGGRISDNAGFLAELGLGGTGAALASAKLPALFKIDEDKRAGFVFFATDDLGASYGFETMNTGANSVHIMSNTSGFNNAHSQALSAQQYINTGGAATGIAFVANAEWGLINVTKYNQVGIVGTPESSSSGANSASLNSTYIRAATFFDLKKFDIGLGAQRWSGISADGKGDRFNTKAFALDGQIQGTFSETPVGFYASYARAPAVTIEGATLGNIFNVDGNGTQGTAARSSFNFSGEASFIPEVATLGLGFRLGKSGQAILTNSNASDNALILTASYKIVQNILTRFSYTRASGDYWTQANKDAIGNHTYTINLFALF